jgi:hypothetical protein
MCAENLDIPLQVMPVVATKKPPIVGNIRFHRHLAGVNFDSPERLIYQGFRGIGTKLGPIEIPQQKIPRPFSVGSL